jgi:DNA replication factor GINS
LTSFEDPNTPKIEEIFNVLRREIQQVDGGPEYISNDFYQNIAYLISVLKGVSLENESPEKKNEVSGQIKAGVLDMIAKMSLMLFMRRCKKIFNVQQTRDPFDYSNLTDEEKYIFYSNKERQRRIHNVLDIMLDGKPKTLERMVSSINESYLIIRFLDTMEQFVGINMNKYGPFKKDDIAILPFENARSIIESNKAIEIDIIS